MDTLYIRLVTLGLVTAKGRIKKRNCPSPPPPPTTTTQKKKHASSTPSSILANA